MDPGGYCRSNRSPFVPLELQCGRVVRRHVDAIHKRHVHHIPLHLLKTFTFLLVLGLMTLLQCLTVRNPLLLGNRLVLALLLSVMVLPQRLDLFCEILEGGSVAYVLYCTLNCLCLCIKCACMPNFHGLPWLWVLVYIHINFLICLLCLNILVIPLPYKGKRPVFYVLQHS